MLSRWSLPHDVTRKKNICNNWHASFMFYKEKSNNNYSLGSKLLIHLSNVTLKKNRYFYECFSYCSNINYQQKSSGTFRFFCVTYARLSLVEFKLLDLVNC